MKRSKKKIVALMIILLIVLIGVIVYLVLTDKKQVPEEDLGQTVISETASEQESQTASSENTSSTDGETVPAPEAETVIAVPTSVDLPNEKEVRLYLIDFGEHTAELVTEYNSTWDPAYDINIFDALNSDQSSITYDDYFTLHQLLWDSVDTTTQYKIGFELSFDVDGEHKVITILEPADISGNPDLFMGDAENEEVTGYLGAWVYNDIGHDGPYVHLTQEDMADGVLMTSIKLRPTPQSYQISNLKLKVFSYSSDEEFDASGRYIGTHGYEIAVNNR